MLLITFLFIASVRGSAECESALLEASTQDDKMTTSHIQDVYTNRDIQLNKLALQYGQNWVFSHSEGPMKVGHDLAHSALNHPNSDVCKAKGVVRRLLPDGKILLSPCQLAPSLLQSTSMMECSPSHWTPSLYGPTPTVDDWACGYEKYSYAYGVALSAMSAFPGPPLTITDRHSYTQYHEAVRGKVLDTEMAYEHSLFFGDNNIDDRREVDELMNEHNIAMEQVIQGVRVQNYSRQMVHAKYATLHPHMSRTTHHRSSRFKDWMSSRFVDPAIVRSGDHYLAIKTPERNYSIPLVHDMASDDLAGYVWCEGGFCSVGEHTDIEHLPSYSYWNQSITFFASNASLYTDKLVPEMGAPYTTNGKRAHSVLKLLIALSYIGQKTTISRLASVDDIGKIAYYYVPISSTKHELLMLPVLGKLIRYDGPLKNIGYSIQVAKRVYLNFHASFGLSWSLKTLHQSCAHPKSFTISEQGEPISNLLAFNEIGKLDDGTFIFWRHTVPSKLFPFYYLIRNPKVLQIYSDSPQLQELYADLYANHSLIDSRNAHLAHYGIKQSSLRMTETLFSCHLGICTFTGPLPSYAEGRALTTDGANFLFVLLGVGLTIGVGLVIYYRSVFFGLCIKAATKIAQKGSESPVAVATTVASANFGEGLACSEIALINSRSYCHLSNCSGHLLLNCSACLNFPLEIGSCLLQVGFKHEVYNLLFVLFMVMIVVMFLWGHSKWTHLLFGIALILVYVSMPALPMFDVLMPTCTKVQHLSSVSHCELKLCDSHYLAECSPCRALPTEMVRCFTGHLFGEEFYSFLLLLFVISLVLTIVVPRDITLGWIPYGLLIIALSCFIPKTDGIDLVKKADIAHMFDDLAFPYATYFNTNSSADANGKVTTQMDSVVKHAFGPHIGVKVRLAPSLEITYYGQAFYGGPCQFQAYCDGGECLQERVYACDHFCPGESEPGCAGPGGNRFARPGWAYGNGIPVVVRGSDGEKTHMYRCMKSSFSSTGACFLCCSSGVKTITVGIERLPTCQYLEHCLSQDLSVEMDFYLRWNEGGVNTYYYGMADVSAAQSFCLNNICIKMAHYEKDVGTRHYMMMLPYGNDSYSHAWQLPGAPADFGYCDTQFSDTNWKSENFTSKTFETYDLPTPSSNDGGCYAKRAIPNTQALSQFPEIATTNTSLIGQRGFRKVRREILTPRITDSWIQGAYVSSYVLGTPCLAALTSGKTYEAIRGSGHATVLSLEYENSGDPGLVEIFVKNAKVIVEPSTIVVFKGAHKTDLNLYPQDATTQGSLCAKTCSERCTPLDFKSNHPTGTIIPPNLAVSMLNKYDNTWQNAIGAVTGAWSTLTGIFGNIGTYFFIIGIILLILLILFLAIYCYRMRKMKRT